MTNLFVSGSAPRVSGALETGAIKTGGTSDGGEETCCGSGGVEGFESRFSRFIYILISIKRLTPYAIAPVADRYIIARRHLPRLFTEPRSLIRGEPFNDS